MQNKKQIIHKDNMAFGTRSHHQPTSGIKPGKGCFMTAI